MADYRDIYENHADRYDELVSKEDHAGNLGSLFDRLLAGRPARVVELGCGTGRVTRMLASRAEQVRAYDVAPRMVDFAKRTVAANNVSFGVADNSALPEPDGEADFVVAGWTLGHVTGFFPDAWKEHATRALAEMCRCASRTGKIIVIETLGTCVDTPAPPNERLAAFYRLLEEEYVLTREEVQTDYAFASVAEAARIMGFFFGSNMEQAVNGRGLSVVPEWTGVWSGAPR